MSGSDSSTVHRPQTASVADSRPLWLRRIEEQVHAFDRALWMVPSMARTKLTDDLRAHLLSEADHGGKAPHDSVATAILRLGSMTTMVAGARRLYGLRWELRLLRAVLLGIAVTATTPLVGSMVLLTTPLVILVLALAGMEMGLDDRDRRFGCDRAIAAVLLGLDRSRLSSGGYRRCHPQHDWSTARLRRFPRGLSVPGQSEDIGSQPR